MQFNSFTQTWLGFAGGSISAEDLLSSECVQFSCCRDHLFPDAAVIAAIGGNTFPTEVSWVRGARSYYEPRIPASVVAPAIVEKFKQFLTIVETLEARGVVTYRGDELSPKVWRIENTIESYRTRFGGEA